MKPKKRPVRYINRRGDGYRETVDEFPYSTREDRACAGWDTTPA